MPGFEVFSVVFLFAVILATGLQAWLYQRQLRSVHAHRAQVPPAFAEKIPLAAHHKAADYTIAKIHLGRWALLYNTILLLGWTLGGGLQALAQTWQTVLPHPLWLGVVVILSTLLISSLLELPFGIYSTFGIEQAHGFNRTTPALYIIDKLKGLLLALLLGGPILTAILWLMQYAGEYWWAYAWVVWMVFSFFVMWIFPSVLAPLFNKFTPLDNNELKQRIHTLLQRCGFTSRGIFIMDGSKRSTHGNAYFTGFGQNKRIVFFDTLLKHLRPEEIEAVLAHELGHFKHRHVQKSLLVSALLMLGGFALLGWLAQQPWFYTGLGVKQVSLPLALLLFVMVMPVFSVYLQPAFAYFSRRHEFEADDFAASQTNPADLIAALVKLYEENANTLTPDPWYSAFHESHPPAPVRVAYLQSKLATT
ncbi:MAG: M48 family metallopeptidase [Gammaproteobacteria bacterium]|nr:M48 family metallopeptidase [Gammaproteobacteria bacterium]